MSSGLKLLANSHMVVSRMRQPAVPYLLEVSGDKAKPLVRGYGCDYANVRGYGHGCYAIQNTSMNAGLHSIVLVSVTLVC